jgi:hypothetical protein
MLKKTAFLPGETYIQKLELPAIGQISKVSIIKDDGDDGLFMCKSIKISLDY